MITKRLFAPRVFVVSATFALAMLVLIDRVAISVAKEPLASELSLTDTQFGWCLSVFALGYAVFQSPMGFLADRLGPRKTLTAVVGAWSFFTALTGVTWNLSSMLVVRLCFGIGEAGAFPGISRVVTNWIPPGMRGLVNGINFSGGRIGAALSLPVLAYVIDIFGWLGLFYLLGSAGCVWACLWLAWFRDSPSGDRQHVVIKEEIDPPSSQENPTHLRQMLTSATMIRLMAQYFASNFTFFFCLTWLYPHLKERFELNVVEAGLYSAWPLIAGAVGNIFSGLLVDQLFKVTTRIKSIAIPAMAGFLISSLGLLGSLYTSEVISAVAFLSLAVFGADMTLAPSWVRCADVGGRNTGIVSGTMNMAGNLGSFLTALAFPYLYEITGSSKLFFFIAAALNVIAAAVWFRMIDTKTGTPNRKTIPT